MQMHAICHDAHCMWQNFVLFYSTFYIQTGNDCHLQLPNIKKKILHLKKYIYFNTKFEYILEAM